jgi:glycosyltransferase involved in cell wall biosynthesis
MKKTSVIIPAFNCERTIRASVLSILDGNGDAVSDLIIVDDRSTDNTLLTLRELSAQFKKITLISHDRNLGGASARNTAINNCPDGYIFCLDSDNLLVPGSLKRLIDFAEENKADISAFRELHFFSGSPSNITHLWRYPAGQFKFADYIAGSVVPGASGNYLYKKSAWQDVGGYRTGSGALDSWVFGLDLLASGKKMYVSNDGFYLHRYGLQSYWVRERKRINMGISASSFIAKYIDQLDEDSRQRVRKSAGSWFEQIDMAPLKLVDSDVGCPGVVINKSIFRKFQSVKAVIKILFKKYFN